MRACFCGGASEGRRSGVAQLLHAAEAGAAADVKRLLQAGVPASTAGADGNSALHLAAAGGHVAVMQGERFPGLPLFRWRRP